MKVLILQYLWGVAHVLRALIEHSKMLWVIIIKIIYITYVIIKE
jgi:hypothetical protein